MTARATNPEIHRRTAALRERWGLSPRQAQVLEHLVMGRSNKEISGLLGCAEATVERHVSALFQKAGAKSRLAVVAKFWTVILD